MFQYILKRTVISFLTIMLFITAVFFLVRAMPGELFLNADRRDER